MIWNNAITSTASPPTAQGILALVRSLKPPKPEQVIITPSVQALIDAGRGLIVMDPTNRRTTDGIRVVVTKYIDRPRLIPAAALAKLPATTDLSGPYAGAIRVSWVGFERAVAAGTAEVEQLAAEVEDLDQAEPTAVVVEPDAQNADGPRV